MVDFKTLNGPQLVAEYNRMASDQGLPGIVRFSNVTIGRRRCSELANGGTLDAFTQFNTSTRKNRGKLLKALIDKKGNQNAINDLIRAVYGSANMDKRGALLMVLRGLQNTIRKDRLPYRIEKSKSEAGVINYGLYDQA
jgi:hypothetical protein